MSAALGMSIAALLTALHAHSAYVAGCALFSKESTAVRLCASSVISLWLLLATFQVLAWLGLFTVLAALTALGVTSAAAQFLFGSTGTIATAQADLDVAATAVHRALRSPERWFYIVASLLLAFAAARGLLTPPLAHDALTYHSFLAASWVQH